jgi:SAM-dependent methyltransferase
VARDTRRAAPWARPSPWLTSHADLLPRTGAALDVACGGGRHALWLAARGLDVRAVDRDAAALDRLRAAASDARTAIRTDVMDLESGTPDLGGGYDVIVVVNYLHRPLFPRLLQALAPSGLLLYETFLAGHAAHRRPSSPEHLLDPGELRRLVASLEVLDEREGERDDGRLVAGVVARSPGRSPL